MVISYKVVAFAVFAVAVVGIDSYLAHSKTKDCYAFLQTDSMFSLADVETSTLTSNPMSSATRSSAPIELSQTAQSQLNQCLAAKQNQVSWFDWVFSNSDSGTFHYLDLLELLTPNNDSDYSSGAPNRPATQ